MYNIKLEDYIPAPRPATTDRIVAAHYYAAWKKDCSGIAEGSRTHNGLKCHFCPSLRYLHREIRPVCPCASALT